MMENNDRFSVALMNPPFGSTSNVFLDQQFVEKGIEISDNCIAVFPNRLATKTSIGERLMTNKRLKSIEFYNAEDVFDIHPAWRWVGVYSFMSESIYNKIQCTDLNNEITYIDRDFDSRSNYILGFKYSKNIIKLASKLESLYNKLISDNKRMVNDTDDFIYEENRLQGGKRWAGTTKKTISH